MNFTLEHRPTMSSCEPFVVIITGDGSPSLCLGGSGAGGEAMHAREGAWRETCYIYGAALELAREKSCSQAVLSVGLGLGYNEFLLARHALLTGTQLHSVTTFESVPELRSAFTHWLAGTLDCGHAWVGVYARIAQIVSATTTSSADELRRWMAERYARGEWKLGGAFPPQSLSPPPYGCILYDAFSPRTSPELWTQECLDQVLGEMADASSCVFATYAANGELKRALRRHGFRVVRKNGFGRKRESTLAHRSG